MTPDKKYEDKVLAYLVEMSQGSRIEVASLTHHPDRFIEAVKFLIDDDWLRNGEYYFSNDYRFICRQAAFKRP